MSRNFKIKSSFDLKANKIKQNMMNILTPKSLDNHMI